jgi:hypothetical protein
MRRSLALAGPTAEAAVAIPTSVGIQTVDSNETLPVA